MISAIILSGGKASRMGGEKSFRKTSKENKYLIEKVADILVDMNLPFITVFKNPKFMNYDSEEVEKQTYFKNKYKQPITWDTIEGKGPLIGIYEGMKISKGDWILVLPCDMPHITRKAIEKLIKNVYFAEKNGYNCIVPKHKNGFIEPLFSLYHISSISKLENIVNQIKESGKSAPIRLLIDSLNPLYVDAQEIDINQKTYVNINTFEDFDNLNKDLGKRVR
ncbi:molybdenum cofactor guanylyltransferase [Methanococcus voltae]|uniref:Probable molybdenum cofactor guanylyltransferase n=1 Tax=Methanococcus voltae (strain ATCC BAA-1334 / A3) TaxID=456320 RepID=D7DRN1_METV3|nr:molybdenum cofactor guanylyltransferase [Methanococcus voltae]MCS3901108.1 molybdopterin-guanine dinucleotide biosynthesis protein A [Methanococcus voltae]